MKKLKQFFNEIDWKDLVINMLVFLGFFTLIAIGMLVTGTWSIFSKPMYLFYGIGIIISFIINLLKQFK